MAEQQQTETFFPTDDQDGEFLDMLAAEAVEYIHDEARTEVLDVLTNTDNTAEAVAATSYKITKGLLERHKKTGIALEADMSHALALGTEVTDMLVEIVEATQEDAIIDGDALREEALLRATVMHGEDVEKRDDPDEKEEAQVMYATMMEDGSVDQAMGYVNQRSGPLGLNTNDMMRVGTQEGASYAQSFIANKDPIAEGVAKGMENMMTPAMARGEEPVPPLGQEQEPPPQPPPPAAMPPEQAAQAGAEPQPLMGGPQ